MTNRDEKLIWVQKVHFFIWPDLFRIEENIFSGCRVANGYAASLLIDLAVLGQVTGKNANTWLWAAQPFD